MEIETQEKPRVSRNLKDFGETIKEIEDVLSFAKFCSSKKHREHQVSITLTYLEVALRRRNTYLSDHDLPAYYNPIVELMHDTIAQGIIEIGSNLTTIYQGGQK